MIFFLDSYLFSLFVFLLLEETSAMRRPTWTEIEPLVYFQTRNHGLLTTVEVSLIANSPALGES